MYVSPRLMLAVFLLYTAHSHDVGTFLCVLAHCSVSSPRTVSSHELSQCTACLCVGCREAYVLVWRSHGAYWGGGLGRWTTSDAVRWVARRRSVRYRRPRSVRLLDWLDGAGSVQGETWRQWRARATAERCLQGTQRRQVFQQDRRAGYVESSTWWYPVVRGSSTWPRGLDDRDAEKDISHPPHQDDFFVEERSELYF